MSYRKSVTLSCDEVGCNARYKSGVRKVGTARDYAANCGWSNEGMEDFCPEHSGEESSGMAELETSWGGEA